MPRFRLFCILFSLFAQATIGAGPQAVSTTFLGTVTAASMADVPNGRIIVTDTQTLASHAGLASGDRNDHTPDPPAGGSGLSPVLQTETATGQIERTTLVNVPLIGFNRSFQSLLNPVPGLAPVAGLTLTVPQRLSFAANRRERPGAARQSFSLRFGIRGDLRASWQVV